MKPRSASANVTDQIIANLPHDITVYFEPDLDEEGNPGIFIHAPKYQGLISEADTFDEAIYMAGDAILTYFDVPKDCARLIDFEIVDKPTRSQRKIIKRFTNPHAVDPRNSSKKTTQAT